VEIIAVFSLAPQSGERVRDRGCLIVRLETDKLKIESFMAALGKQVQSKGRIYLTGGATAVSSWLAAYDH
jgi:hypothetical protein